MIHSQHGLDMDELKKLVRGGVHWRKCLMCDLNGLQYWDGKTGEGLSASPSGIDQEWLERGSCETCYGLGFYFYRD